MSRNKVEFPWNGEMEFERVPLPPPPENDFMLRLKSLKNYIPVFICLLMILSVTLCDKKPEERAATSAYKKLDVLISMLPQKKGSPLNPALLKQVPIGYKDVTKSERLILLQERDLEKLPSSIILKKDLPPRKPISWKDLTLQKSVPKKHKSAIYRGENPNANPMP